MTFDPVIDVRDSSSWPLLLTVEQIAAIWQLTVATVNRKVSDGSFVPMPIEDSSPRRWRKVDVIRHVEPNRARRIA
jgi:hypothetical protein